MYIIQQGVIMSCYRISAVVFFLSLSLNVYGKTFQVQIESQPDTPNGVFYARIVSANFTDKTPNTCYQRYSCSWRGFVNSKSWGENGRVGYETNDTYNIARRESIAFKSKTMGDLATNLKNDGLLYITVNDYLRAGYSDPTFCIYAYIGKAGIGQIYGSLASNCADAPIKPATCEFKSNDQINFDWGTVTQSTVGYREISKNFQLTCSKPTQVKVSISGYSIPLNGIQKTRAEFNLGDGWSGEIKKSVSETVTLELKARLIGLENVTGNYTGSAILLLETI